MKIEYEARVLEIDVLNIIQKLEKLGAKKMGQWEQKRYVYDLHPKQEGKWIRLRTNGEAATLTYKDIISPTIDGTKEVEVVVSDFLKTHELLQKIGFSHKGYQENKRIQYQLHGVEIDIDTWPRIPSYLEVEGSSKQEVEEMLSLLEVSKEKVTTLDVQSIYEKYGITLSEIKELTF